MNDPKPLTFEEKEIIALRTVELLPRYQRLQLRWNTQSDLVRSRRQLADIVADRDHVLEMAASSSGWLRDALLTRIAEFCAGIQLLEAELNGDA